MMQHNGDWVYGPLMKACSICSIMTRVLVATFQEKSQVANSLAFNKTFNTTDSLFNSPVCEVAYCFFRSLLALRVNCCCDWTNKVKIDGYRQWNLKLKLKWGPKTHTQLPIIAIGGTVVLYNKIIKEKIALYIKLTCKGCSFLGILFCMETEPNDMKIQTLQTCQKCSERLWSLFCSPKESCI